MSLHLGMRLRWCAALFLLGSCTGLPTSDPSRPGGTAGLDPHGEAPQSPLVGSAFTGETTDWHGFDRYDFVLDEQSLMITPLQAPAGENTGVKDPEKGHRRCIVVVPKRRAPGHPWSWRGCYWDHQPQAEIELLKRGFHVAYISANATLKPGKEWDAWYAFLTLHHGLSSKPAMIGMSRGGEYAYTWAAAHPSQVSCIYADNPGLNRKTLGSLGDLAAYDVPLLHVCGSIDPLLGKNSDAIETLYQHYGGRITVMIKEGFGHHPHSLRDPKPIADFIEESVGPRKGVPPAFAGEKFTKSSFYGVQNHYLDFPSEGTYLSCRGPLFAACYDRYDFTLDGVQGAITAIVPKTTAPGTPWVFRSDATDRHSEVDLALLAKGFHLVTGPVPFNADGPLQKDWDAVYHHLTDHGFSRKPVMEGAGGAAGDAYAWALQNPNEVSCICAENPVLRSTMTKAASLFDLGPLAKAGVPLLHVCGSLDPWLKDHTREVEKRYQELGGRITVILHEGVGHSSLGTKHLDPVLEFIAQHAQ